MAEAWDGLRRATVRLVDPANPSVWGTGFFIARDVLLTCWHVVRDVAEQRVLVEQPLAGKSEASSLAWQILGEATLLEAGQGWDLALLSFHPSPAGASGGWARPPVVLPLGEQDPPPGAQLLSSGFPEDAASRHDATYAATGRTTPPGQKVEFLRLKADGVVPGVSGAALVEAETGRVCGVLARNELVGGASDGGLAVPLAVFRTAFPEQGEAVQGRNRLEGQEWGAAAQPRLGRPDWSWPTAWDFRSYREDKRKDFVGRSWLFADVRAWALNPDPKAPQALLIGADYGVGKSAFLAELLATNAAGLPVAAHHFCTSEQEATLTPALFVRNLAVQLAHAQPAYRQALEAEEAKEPRQWLDEAERDPSRAFDQAILAPLLKIDPPSTAVLWVVDALDEAQEVRAGGSPGAQLTIVQLLARNASRLPRWIKVLATSRRRPDVLNPLLQAFSLQQLDAEEARNLEDLFTYALERCRRTPLAERLEQAGLSAEEVARFLSAQEQSSGKFLYLVRVLNDLASGRLPLLSRADLEQLPPGMDGFYQDAFVRRFPSEESYAPVRDILGVLCEQREPLGRKELAAILSGSGQAIAERQVLEWLKPMHDLLRLVSRTEQINGDKRQIVLHGFDHVSLPQWLSEADEWGYERADRFMVDRTAAAEQIHRWAKAVVSAEKAHTWPYLVRHLGGHLTAEERPEVMAGLLGDFDWLEARLRLAGINALLGDFAFAAPSPWLDRLERALRQGAHVLKSNGRWSGDEQLASQLLARLAGDCDDALSLRKDAISWIHKTRGFLPLSASLASQDALLRTLTAPNIIGPIAALPNGQLAYACWSTIEVRDPSTDECSAVLEGHLNSISDLIVLPDGRLASSSCDNSIRIWDLVTSECSAVLYGHQHWVNTLATLPDGRLVSGSRDSCIRIWDLTTGDCLVIRMHNHDGVSVESLGVLADGRIVACLGEYDKSGLDTFSYDKMPAIIINPQTGIYAKVVGDIHGNSPLAILPDGRVAFVNNNNFPYIGKRDHAIIIIWDLVSGALAEIETQEPGVSALAVLPDGRLVSGCFFNTIRIWNLTTCGCEAIFKLPNSESGSVFTATFPDGTIASHSDLGTLQIWNTTIENSLEIGEPIEEISAMAVLSDGRVVTGCNAGTIQVWGSKAGSSLSNSEWAGQAFHVLATLPKLEGFDWHAQTLHHLASLPNGLLASAFGYPGGILLWNPDTGSHASVLKGHQASVLALVVLPNGQLASGSYDNCIRLWDTASGSCLAVFEGHQGSVNALAVLPDGRLASGSSDHTIRLWDLQRPPQEACQAVFEGHQDSVRALAVLPDGRLVSDARNETLRLWDPASGTCCAVFEGGSGRLAILPDSRLASGSDCIFLWDLARPSSPPQVIFVSDTIITALMVHPKRNLLLAGDYDNRLHWLELPDQP
jgi:WD40 repeat protein